MTTKPAYKRVIEYHFECAGEHWSLSVRSSDCVHIEETRKNGQEDTHMSLELTLKNGKWKPDTWDLENGTVATYLGKSAVKKLAAYVNKHGVPELEIK